MKIGFIGAGNMGGAILRGALRKGIIENTDTSVFGVNLEKLEAIKTELKVSVYTDIEGIVSACDILFLGFKPQKFDEIMPKIAKTYMPDKVIVSMAAGISIDYISGFIGENSQIIRIMPNTPAQVGEAMVSVSRNKNVCEEAFLRIFKIFEGIGKAEEVPEELIHCVIGVSGSSPAYTYMYIDALVEAAVKNGMDREKATKFAAQAVLGAAKMVLETGIDPEQLRLNVCSPGGTTIEGVKRLQEDGFEGIVENAFNACVEKSKKMTK